ncbi:Uncharacterised protein [uncultured Roseburia sp.]|nr:Uncharacterised protein [uncultured Roseburia sp.]
MHVMYGFAEGGESTVPSSRRQYFRKTRKVRRREQKNSVTGILSGIFGLTALVMFFVSVIKTFQSGGNSGFLLGTAGLFGLVFAAGAFALGILAFKEKNIRLIPPRTGAVSGGILAVVYLGLYIYGIII